MQEKLSESTQANAVLSAQLENISPQLTSLETALSNSRQKLKEEQKLRRAAEQSSDENDQKFRELEQTVNSLKEELDELHEELAFKENELEETRLELEVEKQQLVNQITDLKNSNGAVELSEDAEYTKKLEEELEVVTEQLIETEKKLADSEDALQHKVEQLERTTHSNLQNDQTEEKNADLELKLSELEADKETLQHQIGELTEEINLNKEEIALTNEELQTMEAELKSTTETLNDERVQHQNELKTLNEALKESRIDSTSSRKEIEVISGSLQDYNKEIEQRNVQNAALERALENMKADYEKLSEELDLVNERFDTVKSEAEQAGREAAFEETRENMKVDNDFEISKIQENLQILQNENKALQDKIDVLNSSPTTEGEATSELQTSLEHAKAELSKKESEMSALTKELESRLSDAERKVTELEAELHTAKGQLAEADAHLIVLKAKAEQADIPKSPRQEETKTPPARARSASPSSVMRLELRLSEEQKLREDLEKKYSELEDQKRMAEVRIKHLEEELRKHVNGTIVVQNTGTSLFDDENVDEIIESRDVKKMAEELKSLNEKCASQRNYNAQLLSKMLHLQGNIQVYARVRPMSEQEINSGSRCVVEALSENELGTFDSRINKWKSFNFDKVWGPEQSQNSIFQDVEPLALSVVDGFNACIFAYGQTGSGKTYTMEGLREENQYGISYRTIQKIFHLLKIRQQQQKAAAVYVGDDEPQEEVMFSFELKIGMLEIYNDEVYDLLGTAGATMAEKKENAVKSGGKASLEIRRTPEGRVDVPNLTKESVDSIDEVMELLRRGNANRATASTDLNEHSSRSHMVLSVDVVSGVGEASSNKGTLYLVDLAGSERVRKSNVEGDNLKEAGFINKSLSALGNVMEALDRKASHVPYRDSKLTYLLQNSLGGNSRTMMIVTICPMHNAHDESVHALQFATRVRRIQIGSAKRNVTSKNLEETVKKLTEEMRSLTRAKERSEGQLMSLKRDNTRVQEKLNNLSTARTQHKTDSRTLEVLRKNNDEMAARWHKEKSIREETVKDLDKSKKELRMTQHQLNRFKSKLNQLEQTLEDKERSLERANDEIRSQRNRKSAATVRSRRTEVLTSRSRTPSASTSIQSPSPPRTNVSPSPRTNVSTARSSSTSTPPTLNGAKRVGPEADVAVIRSKVLALLEKHDKAKVDRIDIIMEKFQGKEALLLEKMTQRYESRLLSTTSSVALRNEQAMQRHQERMQRIHDKRAQQNGV